MTNMLKNGAEFLASYRKEVMSTIISIERDGAVIAPNISATVGSTRDESDDKYGGAIREQSRDYIIAAADYGAPEPQRGDIILEGTSKFIVLGDRGVSPWDTHDNSGLSYRVRTKQES